MSSHRLRVQPAGARSPARALSSPNPHTNFPGQRRLLGLAVQTALLSLLGASMFSLPAQAQNAPATSSYSIPASGLATALQAVARQAGVRINTDNNELKNRTAPRLQGSYTVDGALAALLAGSGLQARRTEDGSYRIVSTDSATRLSYGVNQESGLPEVRVNADKEHAYKPPRAGTTTVITNDELARRGASDAGSIVRYEPLISAPMAASGGGSVWDGAGNTGFNIRGIEGNRVSMDVDGISLPDAAPKPDGNSLNAFGIGRDYYDPETFREVRIGSGTTATGAGTPGIGGGVAFVTKSPEDFLVDGRQSYMGYKLGYNSANSSYAHTLTGAAQSGNLQALAVYVHRKGKETESKGDVPVNPDDWTSDALLAKFNWTLTPEQKLGFTVDAYQRENKRIFNNKQNTTTYPEGARQDSNTKRTRISVDHHYAPSGFALFDTLDTRVYGQDAKVDDVTDARYVFQQNYQRHISTGYYNKSYGIASDAFKQLDSANKLAYGISLEQTETRRPWYEDRIVIATGVHQFTMKNRMADTDMTKLAAHVRDDVDFDLAGHKSTFSAGLRAEYRKLAPKNLAAYLIAVPGASKEIKEESETFVTPSLSLAVELTPGLDAYAQYNRGVRLPTAAERTGTYDSFSYTGAGNGYAVLGNPKLQKETSDAVEFGLKGTPVQGVHLRSAVFYTRYKNFVEYVAQPADPVNYPTITQGLFRPENIGKVRTWGGELSSQFELGTWSAPLAGYSVAAAAGISHGSAENTETGQRGDLASIAPFKGSASVAYDDPAQRFGLALIATHADGKLAGNDVISGITTPRFSVPGYSLLDFTAYWNISKNARLNVGIYNLGDKKYWDYASTRSLAAGTTAAARADIERQAMPGRNAYVSLSLNY